MKKMRVFVASALVASSAIVAACAVEGGEPISAVPESEHGMGYGGREDVEVVVQGNRAKGESSPFIVGAWKFAQQADGTITADTEFRFINPTDVTLNLEYAFFEADTGKICGCDSDQLAPNQTTIYTVKEEKDENFFRCVGKSGALKSIVFLTRNGKKDKIFLDDATHTGFQTHVFASPNGPVVERDPNDPTDFLTGGTMTEAGMKGITINKATIEDIELLHRRCPEFLSAEEG